MTKVQSYRNRFMDLQSKSMDLFLYDRDLRHERKSAKIDQQHEMGYSYIYSYYKQTLTKDTEIKIIKIKKLWSDTITYHI